jgi:transposase
LRRIARKLWRKDANRRRILHRLRKLWQNRSRGTVLLFCDVKPVAVKAYGGRRYSKKRLVLSRGQKSYGLFYLFVAYEYNTGRRLWGFYAGKSSRYVCQFFKKIRRRYGEQKLHLAVDRDSPHPIKCARTRRQLRALGIHWTSLPKGHPDDNPVETIFSDVQQSVLDTSSDTEQAVTQQRISRHLQGCNRRTDRRIRVSYLEIPLKLR